MSHCNSYHWFVDYGMTESSTPRTHAGSLGSVSVPPWTHRPNPPSLECFACEQHVRWKYFTTAVYGSKKIHQREVCCLQLYYTVPTHQVCSVSHVSSTSGGNVSQRRRTAPRKPTNVKYAACNCITPYQHTKFVVFRMWAARPVEMFHNAGVRLPENPPTWSMLPATVLHRTNKPSWECFACEQQIWWKYFTTAACGSQKIHQREVCCLQLY